MSHMGLEKRQTEDMLRYNEEGRFLELVFSRGTEADDFAMMVNPFLCLSDTDLSWAEKLSLHFQVGYF